MTEAETAANAAVWLLAGVVIVVAFWYIVGVATMRSWTPWNPRHSKWL